MIADNSPAVKNETSAPTDQAMKLCENEIATITPATDGALALLYQKMRQY
jgi:hypothetical protein